jgi:hypothetical protein
VFIMSLNVRNFLRHCNRLVTFVPASLPDRATMNEIPVHNMRVRIDGQHASGREETLGPTASATDSRKRPLQSPIAFPGQLRPYIMYYHPI